ncbi:dTMP kinase [Kamptonema animale CS-326]|jgi:dTMP kinase|uniref:dTMP kinase n=1 Tax=Kamptonema animale TaxID=92934 RepID=UPI00232A8D00|nr:dTMP kinase [Kamptonema animale]MDB9515289.1 dTMP kinase [Kamptonema animale CS-326]
MDGKLIVFEGVEGSGKTTQIERSRLWLLSQENNCKVPQIVVTREPGGTDLGKGLRGLLLESGGENICDRAELLLYAADRAQHVEAVLKPELAKGSIVLCDRFTDSTIAYQGYGRGLSLSLINQLNEIATVGLQSDLTLWLDLEVEVGLRRVKRRGVSDRIEQADLEFHRRVQQGFADLATANRDRIIRVDANRSEEEVSEEIHHIFTRKLKDWGYNC